jgi:hypothetical protein
MKVFCRFFSKKTKDAAFSEEKQATRLLFIRCWGEDRKLRDG